MVKLSKLFFVISFLFIIQPDNLSAMEEDASKSLTLHPRILATDQVWWDVTGDTPADNKKLSAFTLGFLDKDGREFLKNHGSFHSSQGELCEGAEDVGKYLIYLKQYLHCGDGGSVYLCEDKSSNEFFVAKSGAAEASRERRELSALHRLESIVSHEGFHYYIQALVDGVNFSSVHRIIPLKQRTEDQRILIAYNFLKELDYLCQRGVEQYDIGSSNTMIDKNGHIFFVDFGGPTLSSDVINRSPIDIDEFQIQSRHIGMLRELWNNIQDESEELESPYAAFVKKILPKRSLLLGGTLEMLTKLMKKNNHPMVLKVRLSEN